VADDREIRLSDVDQAAQQAQQPSGDQILVTTRDVPLRR
jgi:hypothetical protein